MGDKETKFESQSRRVLNWMSSKQISIFLTAIVRPVSLSTKAWWLSTSQLCQLQLEGQPASLSVCTWLNEPEARRLASSNLTTNQWQPANISHISVIYLMSCEVKALNIKYRIRSQVSVGWLLLFQAEVRSGLGLTEKCNRSSTTTERKWQERLKESQSG